MNSPCSAELATCHEFPPFPEYSHEEEDTLLTYVPKKFELELITRMERLGCRLIRRGTKSCFITLCFSKPLSFQS